MSDSCLGYVDRGGTGNGESDDWDFDFARDFDLLERGDDDPREAERSLFKRIDVDLLGNAHLST